MQFKQMFVTAVCVLFLLKLKWPKSKNFYEIIIIIITIIIIIIIIIMMMMMLWSPLDKCIVIKAGAHLEAVSPPLNLGLMRISRSRFKQSKNYLLTDRNICFAVMVFKVLGYLENFWEEIVFLKDFVKFGEIRNIEDLICF